MASDPDSDSDADADPEDHVGKRVVAQSGNQVGTVAAVDDGTLRVEVGPDADPDVLGQLNWDGTVNQEIHELEGRYVSTIGDDVVRLRV